LASNQRLQVVAMVAIAVAVVGVFCTWTTVGPVSLNGTEGPNNGWLVVILAAISLGWTRLMRRDTWTGAVAALGVLLAAIVICWTVLENWVDNRDVLDASVGYGLLLVLAAGVALGVAAVLRGVELARRPRG
jgi:multisubunit Na+/H+ antiporter MnhF subunit